MAKVSIASLESAPAVASPAGAVGQVDTRGLFARGRDPLHLYLHRMAAGASMRVTGNPTERVIYVWRGEVQAGGARLLPRSSAIVEYGASLAVIAGNEGTTLLEFSRKERGPVERAGGHVHLMPDERVSRTVSKNGDQQVGMSLYADSQCPTCMVWLHENEYWDADVETALHFHSEDEVMFVTEGSMRVGNHIYGAGTALAVAANTKYGFFSGPDGLSFVNFRATSPTYSLADGSLVLDEAALWHKACGKPQYLSPQPT